MGLTHVGFTVRNPAALQRRAAGSFLVVIGTSNSLAPSVWESARQNQQLKKLPAYV